MTADVDEHRAPSPPRSVEEQATRFVVRDSKGDVFATVHYEQDPARRAAAKLPTKDEAYRIATQLAKPLELLDAGALVPTQSPPAMPARRFPPPWWIEDIGAAFVVKDSSGQKLGYFYYEEEPGRRSSAKLLTKDEAWRIAANVTELPELLRQHKS